MHTRLTGIQLAEVFLQVQNTPCWKVHMPTKKYDWSVFTTSAVAEKMSWFSVAVFNAIQTVICVMCQILQHNWTVLYCVVRHRCTVDK